MENQENIQDIIERIEYSLNKIRPYIQRDGGDVQFMSFDDGVVTVSMLGACAGCMSLDYTLKDGIEAILMDEVPEVESVQLYNPFSEMTFGDFE
ncbi:MAG: NifU family protein [Erysipelotrichaceae bacterium]|nr:NifU family protein [Erysipelotrichaceae bacterium]